ncbi:MAG: diaminopimelate decarboxylase [Clostridia bacterium]|nr:diaminopimelate decarboxylase [Clostridia bacterium]
MFRLKNLDINEYNHLAIGGCDTVELAQQYGTPLYVMDEEQIRSNMRAYKNAIDNFYDGKGMALYASKALSAVFMYKLASEEGLGVDVVSGGELYTALKAGFDAKNIYFHGNNKSRDEIKMAVDSGVGTIVADSAYELDIIDSIAAQTGKKQDIMFRIKPGVEAHTHEFISTGQIDSKFGFSIENGEADDIALYASKLKNICVKGIHCHIGSQIFELEPFCLAAKVMTEYYIKLKREFGLPLSCLDLGGGFGISYTSEDKPVEYAKYIEAVSQVIKGICKDNGEDLPYILMEPGRSIVGDAGITLYTIGNIKDIKGIRKYVSIDGGMGDNPRYILYDAEYDGILANRATDTPDDVVTVCGKCCESGDIIIKDAHLPKAETGDILAVMSTGAYNYSMSSNYNRIPRPAVVTVKGGKSKIAVKRETYEDIIKNDVI